MAYIKLDDALKVCNKHETFHKKENSRLGMAIVNSIYLDIDNLPTADVAEVKHGKWIDRYSEKYDNHLYECSECGKKALYDTRADELGSIKITQVLSPECPWCGAIMDGGSDT